MNIKDSRIILTSVLLAFSLTIFGAKLYETVFSNQRKNIRNLENKLEISLVEEPIRINNEKKIVDIDEYNNIEDMQYKINNENNIRRYMTNDFLEDSEEILLARMIFGEARNCSLTERIAVAYTVINRVNDGKKWNGETVREVILKPKQYSCFNSDDVNFKKLKDPLFYEPKIFEECLEIAKGVLSKKYPDPTNGATHYFNPSIVTPHWSEEMYKIGKIKTEYGPSKHEFYIER